MGLRTAWKRARNREQLRQTVQNNCAQARGLAPDDDDDEIKHILLMVNIYC